MNIVLVIAFLLGLIACILAAWFILYLKKKSSKLDATFIKTFVYPKSSFTEESSTTSKFTAHSVKKTAPSQRDKTKNYTLEGELEEFSQN